MNFNTPSDNNQWFRLDGHQPPLNFYVPTTVINPRMLDVGMAAVLPPKPLLPLAIPPLGPIETLQKQASWLGFYTNLIGIGSQNTSGPVVPQLPVQQVYGAAASHVEYERQEVGVVNLNSRETADVAWEPVHSTPKANPTKQQSMGMPQTLGQDGPAIGRMEKQAVKPGQYCKKCDSPCQICLYNVSKTTHYGVRVCNACGAFFRRSIRSERQYICKNNDSCNDLQYRSQFYDNCVFR